MERKKRWVFWGADLIVASLCIVLAVVYSLKDATDWLPTLLIWAGVLLGISASFVRPERKDSNGSKTGSRS